ncbi:hypothetical protein Tco_1087670 [Tanacetum coccineum]
MKLVTKRSKKEFHSSYTSSSGDGVDIQSKVPDEQQHTVSGEDDEENDEYESEDDNDEHDSENDNDDEDDNQENVSGEPKSDDDGDDFAHLNLSTYKKKNKKIKRMMMLWEENKKMKKMRNFSVTTETPSEIPNFASLFGFERRVSSLETELSELKQSNQFVEVVSSILGIVDNYLASKMKDAVNVVVQLQSNKLKEEAQAENDEFLKQTNSNIKAIIKDQVKAQVSKIMPKVEKYVIESLGAKMLARSSNQPQTS